MPDDLVVVAAFPYLVDAELCRLKLESAGIESVLLNTELFSTDPLSAPADGGVRVMVRKQDAVKARKTLREDV